ncbi:VOC family protein [Alienimonas chondri]|uniref:VOC domain-containing protein n=1 Tax=Alienimonas chondri TaxID=2681879 RepID=A0ABX1VCG9_9PLAN|nr:VOC family protein [Alienimonas chondri]NNJ25205.1 hypothetical protein [Alienimonas chondri]
MPRPVSALALLPVAALFAALGSFAPADHHEGEKAEDFGHYRKPTIDVGVIVSDVGAAEEFYESVLGFEEIDEFTVSEQIAGDSGLTDYRKFTADVMAIGWGENATRIKLIEMAGRPAARVDNQFISSTYGPSYLTLHVKDMDPILKAAAEHKLKPLAKGPVKIGEKGYLALLRDPDGNFIELVGPRPNMKAEEPVEKAADKATEEAAEATEEAGEAAEKAGEAAGEAAEATEEAAEEAVEEAAAEATEIVEE